MVNRYQPITGMAGTSNGDYVEFTAHRELGEQYQSFCETACTYIDQVARGEITAEEAKAMLLAIRRLDGQ